MLVRFNAAACCRAARVVLFGVGLAGVASAGNEPEKALARVQADVLPKVVHACGVALSLAYDGASLREHNKDIRYDQTDGENQCNEPLRYLWYACQSEPGRIAVKAARISKVVCKGVPGAVGSATYSGGTLTVGRAFEENKPYLRSKKQMENLLKLSLKLKSEDPYYDDEWRALAHQPNPVTSTTTYCSVNGEKRAFDDNLHDPICRRKEDGQVKCFKDGEVVTDLSIVQGRKSGVLTETLVRGLRRRVYREDKQHGEERIWENGKLKSVSWFDAGERVWMRELYPSANLKRYWHQFSEGTAELSLGEDGKVYSLQCFPAAGGDRELSKPCGFGEAKTTSIYDGTGKVNRVVTWHEGVKLKEAIGNSHYSPRSNVAFKDGKKHGIERLFRENNTLSSSISWEQGVQDGRELQFSDDGKKVVSEKLWKAGQLQRVTLTFLNGNPKQDEVYASPSKKRVKRFWDTGKLASEGSFEICESHSYGYDYRDWCEDGVHRTYFEDGVLAQETNYRLGKRDGSHKTWWSPGKPNVLEVFKNDILLRAKRWDVDGKLLVDGEYEPDGSIKLKR